MQSPEEADRSPPRRDDTARYDWKILRIPGREYRSGSDALWQSTMSSPLPLEYQQTLQIASPVARSDSPQPAPVKLVADSGAGLSQELSGLLRDRLRTASLLLTVAFLAFFLKNLLFPGELQTAWQWGLFWGQFGVFTLEALVAIRMRAGCLFFLERLRMTEWLVFGGPAIYLAAWGFIKLTESAAVGNLASVTPAWMLLIFVYALFVPNRWRRAAGVISLMAATPLATTLIAWRFNEHVAHALASRGTAVHLAEMSLLLLLTTVSSIWGVQTIGSLRREAFQARQIGQYKLKKLIGSGGMGEVYLAEHLLLKRPCAVKLIRPGKAGDPQALARFEREVRETARLTHWNTIEIFDYGRTDDGTFYYVMEYLPGMNLEQLVEMHGPLPPERVIYLLTQVCDALAEAHAKGLVHRDIKPANIFAAHRGGLYDVAKLLDFGLVKPSSRPEESRVTQDGMIAGSPLYMSPEQALGDTPDERSDIYALGLVAYTLLTGRPPFQNDKPIKVLLAHAHEAPPSPRELNPHIPTDLEEVVLRSLAKNPGERYRQVRELREALEDCAAAGLWTRDLAANWWRDYGCPHKKQLDREVFEVGLC